MQVTATEAKNRFGSLCAIAEREPVLVEDFEREFGEWIQAQNSWVEQNGVPGADLRPW
jgi:hypothetical protein